MADLKSKMSLGFRRGAYLDDLSQVTTVHSVILKSSQFWLLSITSFLLTYALVRRFNKLARNKASGVTKYDLAKTWIWASSLMIKSVMEDGVAMFHLIQSCCLEFKDKPTDLFIGLLHFVYIGKPEDIEVVLNNSNALQKSGAYKFFKKYLGSGLILASVDKWKRKRRLAAPFFTTKFVDKNYGTMNLNTSDFVEKLRKYSDTNEYFDLTESVAKVTLSIIWEIALGTDLEITEKEMDIIVNGADKFSEISGLRIYRPWLYPDSVFNWYVAMTGWSKHFEEADYFIKKTYENKKRKLQEKLDYIKEHGEDSVKLSYCEHLLRLNETEKQSDDELMQEGVTTIAAGYETSAMTICFALIMLAMNPDIQEKLYSEIIKCSGVDDEDLNSQKIHEMTYLDQCVKETLRLFPPIPFVMRRATNSFQLNNDCRIQKSSNVIIPIIMVHRSPDIYPNPLQWNPDNFAPDRVEGRHKYSFLPFSGGPRACIVFYFESNWGQSHSLYKQFCEANSVCPFNPLCYRPKEENRGSLALKGNKYAMTVIKVTLVKFLKAYRVDTDQSMDDIKLKLEFFLRSASGNKVKLFSRIKR